MCDTVRAAAAMAMFSYGNIFNSFVQNKRMRKGGHFAAHKYNGTLWVPLYFFVKLSYIFVDAEPPRPPIQHPVTLGFQAQALLLQR